MKPTRAAMRAADAILGEFRPPSTEPPAVLGQDGDGSAANFERVRVLITQLIDREFGPVVEALRRIERLLEYPNAINMQNYSALGPKERLRLIEASMSMQDPRATALSVASQALSALEAK